jgi:hypothetical protein
VKLANQPRCALIDSEIQLSLLAKYQLIDLSGSVRNNPFLKLTLLIYVDTILIPSHMFERSGIMNI